MFKLSYSVGWRYLKIGHEFSNMKCENKIHSKYLRSAEFDKSWNQKWRNGQKSKKKERERSILE